MPNADAILVKWDARSRFYDTRNLRYVSMQQLRQWSVTGLLFCIVDSESGADVTNVLMA